MEKLPHLVDIQVGARIRAVRKLKGVSQQRLGAALGISFQQIQKYERGTNRISASMLHSAATFFGEPIEAFFEGIAQPAEQGSVMRETVIQFAGEIGAIELAQLYLEMVPRHRTAVLECARAFTRAKAA